MDNLSISIDPSQLQASLEQTQGPPLTPQGNRSSGKSSPLRGHCVKEYEEQLQHLQHENFNLKLRVFLLEERVGKALGRGDAADIIKNNIELKVENETLKKSLTEKCELLAQASGAIEELEGQQRSVLAAHQAEQLALRGQIDSLKKELEDAEETRRLQSNRLPDESVDLYAQAFGSFVLSSQQQLQPNCNYPDHHSQEEVDELQAKIDELLRQLADRAAELDRITSDYNQSQGQVLEYRQRVKVLEDDIGHQQGRISQLEKEQTTRDQKIAELIKEQENVKANQVVEKDKIIEEKQCQLEQQNKILVEIQITLDEKQKQIEELESALSDRRKKVEELEKSLSKAGRTLQGFVADIQKKEKEMELVKTEGRKKDKRIKDLTAELKEAQEMLNKAKWEAETSGREDNVKAMAEEENERLWAELEEKKRLLGSAERQKALLQQEVDQLSSLRLAVGQKEQLVMEAEMQIATLKRQMVELQQEVAARTRHSLERKEVAASAELVPPTFQQQYEEAVSKAERLEKELVRLRAWKKKTENMASGSAGGNNNHHEHHLRMYKKEVTVLRQRLADSTNACDLLRTRLEEMADFLEEILSMSQQELLNLSNWSATAGGDKRRQALQNSIMQSRELSRSLSQSLMIGVDQSHVAHEDEELLRSRTRSSSSLSATSSSWSVHSSREKSPDRWSDRNIVLPPPGDLDIAPPPTITPAEPDQQQVVEQLRAIVIQLEEQIKQRDVEIAWMNMERQKNINVAAASNSNKSIQTEVDGKIPPVSSTPYHPPCSDYGVSFVSPVSVGVPRNVGLSYPTDSLKKTPESTGNNPAASESEAWSEPDRTVSFARIGLPVKQETNSIAALLSKKSRSHSTTRDADSSDTSETSKRAARRAKSDPNEAKRTSNRIQTLEQENARLRTQLTEVLDSLRSTYDAQLVRDDSSMLDDSSQNKEELSNYSLTEGSTGDVGAAHFIIEALQGRLTKMKELVRRREQRLRETKDLAAQLDLRLKERHFQWCEMELQLKEARDKQMDLEAHLMEAQASLVAKERQTVELRSALDTRETELRGALMKAQLWEDSYQESQKAARQMEADLRTQQEMLIGSKTLLEQQMRLLRDDFEAVKQERCALQNEMLALMERLKNAQVAQASANKSVAVLPPSRRSSQGIQRQFSQMSDYVSDQAVSAEEAPCAVQTGGKVGDQSTSSQRPTKLHLSPDLGIDSDPGRFSSMEHSAAEHKEPGYNTWVDPATSQKKPDEAQPAAPDVLGTSVVAITANCPNCPKWQNKYTKAKQTLAATLEKLQAANMRKEKIDRALNKELGKTHNILCQARGILEHANQAGK